MLWRLTPRVERLWSIAEVAGGQAGCTQADKGSIETDDKCRFRHFSIHGRCHAMLLPESGSELAAAAISGGLGYAQHAEGRIS